MMTLDELKAMVDESLPWPRPRKMKVRTFRIDFDYNSNHEFPWIVASRGVIARKEGLEEVFEMIQRFEPTVKYPDEIQCL